MLVPISTTFLFKHSIRLKLAYQCLKMNKFFLLDANYCSLNEVDLPNSNISCYEEEEEVACLKEIDRNTTVKIACAAGFTLSEKYDTVLCNENYEWSRKIPTCKS